jgi:mannose-1-phosphate guanylyltransferase
MTPPAPSDPWAIVLAAGEGKRLARLTRALYGRDLPKQFAALDGNQTFLQKTLARSVRLTPCERTIVVVSEEHADLARLQLAAYEGVHIVAQPRNVGTLPGLLLPLAHVLRAAPRAHVVVYPSDHHVLRLSPFVDAVTSALANVERAPSRLVLVGARADRAATDLGWILGGPSVADDGLRAVERFVEKPNAAVATRLLEEGALWNTLLFACDGAAFWDGTLAALPALAPPFERYRASITTTEEAAVRREIYETLPSFDLSRDHLSSREGLAVVEMKDAGWSDCGTPERLLACLELNGGLTWLLSRIAATDTVGAPTSS